MQTPLGELHIKVHHSAYQRYICTQVRYGQYFVTISNINLIYSIFYKHYNTMLLVFLTFLSLSNIKLYVILYTFLLIFKIYYGGHGYNHISNTIKNHMILRGFNYKDFLKITSKNPTKWLFWDQQSKI